jgi:hypothetical protein
MLQLASDKQVKPWIEIHSSKLLSTYPLLILRLTLYVPSERLWNSGEGCQRGPRAIPPCLEVSVILAVLWTPTQLVFCTQARYCTVAASER